MPKATYATSYEQKVIRLYEAITSRGGPTLVEDVDFDDCDIYGPAVVVLQGAVKFEHCHFDVPPEVLVIAADETRPYTGVIGLRKVRFYKCRLHNFGILGSAGLLEEFRQQLASQ